MAHNSLRNWFLLILLSLIWGSSFILIKIGLTQFTPIQVGLLRMFISGTALLPFFIRYAKDTSIEVWKLCFMVGLIGSFIPSLCFSISQSVISSSLAGMLNALQPIFVLSISVLVFKTKLPRIQILGVFIGFSGALVLLLTKTSSVPFEKNLLYSLLIVFATLLYGVNVNVLREYLHQESPVKITSLALGLMVLPSAFLLVVNDIEENISFDSDALISLGAIVFLSVIGTALAVIIFNKLIKDAGTLMASSVTFLIPVVAIFWGFVDGEELVLSHFMGILIIFSGVYLITRYKSTTP